MQHSGTPNLFVYVWEYMVKEEKKSEFESIYGPSGDWVQLFNKSDHYLGTVLQRDCSNDLRYLTIDYWESKDAYDAFRNQFAQAYAELDRHCDSLTEKEIFWGNFDGFGALRLG